MIDYVEICNGDEIECVSVIMKLVCKYDHAVYYIMHFFGKRKNVKLVLILALQYYVSVFYFYLKHSSGFCVVRLL